MATIKSYTDLSQSNALAEILPLESADMYYHYNEYEERHYPKVFLDYQTDEIRQEVLELKRNDPCWSLTALLTVLPSATLDSSNNHRYRLHCMERFTEWHDNPVDACYKMIIKLHELKKL